MLSGFGKSLPFTCLLVCVSGHLCLIIVNIFTVVVSSDYDDEYSATGSLACERSHHVYVAFIVGSYGIENNGASTSGKILHYLS